jgi:hypothetical protein
MGNKKVRETYVMVDPAHGFLAVVAAALSRVSAIALSAIGEAVTADSVARPGLICPT